VEHAGHLSFFLKKKLKIIPPSTIEPTIPIIIKIIFVHRGRDCWKMSDHPTTKMMNRNAMKPKIS